MTAGSPEGKPARRATTRRTTWDIRQARDTMVRASAVGIAPEAGRSARDLSPMATATLNPITTTVSPATSTTPSTSLPTQKHASAIFRVPSTSSSRRQHRAEQRSACSRTTSTMTQLIVDRHWQVIVDLPIEKTVVCWQRLTEELETVWSIRLDTCAGSVAVALGEIDFESGQLSYIPDCVVAIFSEAAGRGYQPRASGAISWGPSVRGVV